MLESVNKLVSKVPVYHCGHMNPVIQKFCMFVCYSMAMYDWSIVCVSSGLLLLSDSPHLGESVFGISCIQSSGIYAAALLFVCWG